MDDRAHWTLPERIMARVLDRWPPVVVGLSILAGYVLTGSGWRAIGFGMLTALALAIAVSGGEWDRSKDGQP